MSAELKERDCICPACGRPAKIYESALHPYLRCTFGDCPTNRYNAVCDMATFRRVIEKSEAMEVAK